MLLLLRLRARVPDPEAYEREMAASAPTPATAEAEHWRLPRIFWTYAAFTGATTTGFATFGALSYHLVQRHLLAAAWVPVLYVAAMGVDAVAALATGWLYDRRGPRVLVALPVLTAGVVALAVSNTVAIAAAGSLLWGAAMGVQESTLRAKVADLVPSGRRATAYGLSAGVIGAACLAGGALTGAVRLFDPRADHGRHRHPGAGRRTAAAHGNSPARRVFARFLTESAWSSSWKHVTETEAEAGDRKRPV
ncbi:MFS transporter [Streptomyces sp. NPDC040750]|uniref:MFS transporter n=1 Tax=Streptomyces sp. NPDC040750 TaxID=3154491 RepID=UPI0033F4680D